MLFDSGDGHQSDDHAANRDKEQGTFDKNLYLYSEEMAERPHVASLLNTLANYDVSIPNVDDQQEGKAAPKKANLGTIAGVYLPCIQNIFGVIFFIRLVWIVGTAGAIVGFITVFLCCCVTFTTVISLSAIATNGIVPAGGSYFMISRSLGPEFGGAVGILFYLATTFAGSMYLVGAVEIVLNYLAPQLALYGDPNNQEIMYHNFRTYGTILLILVGIMVYIGVAFVSKLAPIALLCVIISIIGVYVGIFVNMDGKPNTDFCVLGDRILSSAGEVVCSKERNVTNSLFYVYCTPEGNSTMNSTEDIMYQCDPYFDSHEAKLKPAIPGLSSGIFWGIMAGSNRSGDLADAQKSIPAELWLPDCSGVFLFAASYDNLFLRDKFGESVGKNLGVALLAWPHPMVIVIGSLLSTIGAGIQSLTGAPRLLQAIAKDGIIPALNVFEYSNSRNEPTKALFLTLCICELGILIGNLDHIAPILTMCFLMCYMFVNLACTLQSLLKTPNWRPRFRCYHWSMSLLGVLLCLAVMFISSWYYALASIVLAGLIYKYIEFRGAEKEWGDGIRGLALSAARYSLLRLEEGPPHTKNWRPQILVLCKLNTDLVPKHRKLGLTLVSAVLEGEFTKKHSEAQAAKLSLKKVMGEEKVKGFAEVVVCPSIANGLSHLIQTTGLGGLKHNTVIMGWPFSWRQNPEAGRIFIDNVRNIAASKNALLIPRGIDQYPEITGKVSGHIDVWWIVHDGGLLMLLPFLLKQHRVWKNCKLRIFTIAQLEDNSIQMKKDLSTFLYHLRITAEVEVVEMVDTDISAYTYERTLMMEQRSQMLKHLKQRRGTLTVAKLQEASTPVRNIVLIALFKNSENVLNQMNLLTGRDEANVRRMHTAVKLNEVITNKSQDAQLVVINLPGPPKIKIGEENYMEFIEVLTEGLERVLMVRGGGREVITIYS
ncbi:solute carrier family 12 member 7 [Nephila pilipes]|uniref:Solute carrier family 12 member 7 n=1 Tax=Nephila pilipes TaxID=299642 RepID=A0A8X6T4K7_NEPPI|nr:solute carrier family 12 member 7 [Nephila pilipes]